MLHFFGKDPLQRKGGPGEAFLLPQHQSSGYHAVSIQGMKSEKNRCSTEENRREYGNEAS